MSWELPEALRRRARLLLRIAKELEEQGEYDLALSMAEQAAQLAVKAVYAKVLTRVPKGHNLRQLLGYLARVLEETGARNEADLLRRFVAEHRDKLVLLEDAYTQGRYSLPGYTRRDAEEGIEAAERLIELLEELFWRTPST